MRIIPKMSESPPARRKRSAPNEMPLKVCVIQNSIVLIRATTLRPFLSTLTRVRSHGDVSAGLSGSGLFETSYGNLELPPYKSEIRNPKLETIPNDQKQKFQTSGAQTLVLSWFVFGFIWLSVCFGFRASDFAI